MDELLIFCGFVSRAVCIHGFKLAMMSMTLNVTEWNGKMLKDETLAGCDQLI